MTMLPHTSEQAGRPWYRQFWLWVVITPPAVAVIAGLYTVYLSFQNAPALVVDDYQKIGLVNYQKMERDARAIRLGLTGTLRTGNADLEFILVSRSANSGTPFVQGPLLLQFFHPTLKERDFQLTLLADEQGQYRAPLPALSSERYYLQLLPADSGSDAGRWRLVGEWRSEDELTHLAPGRAQE